MEDWGTSKIQCYRILTEQCLGAPNYQASKLISTDIADLWISQPDNLRLAMQVPFLYGLSLRS